MSRARCQYCRRAKSACLCSSITRQFNRTPVLVLRHKDEISKPLGTANLVELGLTQIHLLSGVNFPQTICAEFLAEFKVSSPLLLYPPNSAIDGGDIELDLSTENVNGSFKESLKEFDSLIVVDGTWRNTREVLLANRWISCLPRLGLKNAGPSRYRIRKAEHVDGLSTIEAVAKVLSIFEAAFNTEVFLKPFVEMIDYQIDRMSAEVFQRHYQNKKESSEDKLNQAKFALTDLKNGNEAQH